MAIILAIVGWTKKDESGVEAVAQSPMMTTEEVYREYNRVASNEGVVPDPFVDSSESMNEEPALEDPVDDKAPEDYWEDWDNG